MAHNGIILYIGVEGVRRRIQRVICHSRDVIVCGLVVFDVFLIDLLVAVLVTAQ